MNADAALRRPAFKDAFIDLNSLILIAVASQRRKDGIYDIIIMQITCFNLKGIY